MPVCPPQTQLKPADPSTTLDFQPSPPSLTAWGAPNRNGDRTLGPCWIPRRSSANSFSPEQMLGEESVYWRGGEEGGVSNILEPATGAPRLHLLQFAPAKVCLCFCCAFNIQALLEPGADVSPELILGYP